MHVLERPTQRQASVSNRSVQRACDKICSMLHVFSPAGLYGNGWNTVRSNFVRKYNPVNLSTEVSSRHEILPRNMFAHPWGPACLSCGGAMLQILRVQTKQKLSHTKSYPFRQHAAKSVACYESCPCKQLKTELATILMQDLPGFETERVLF